MWKKVLRTAEKVNKEVYNILHGFRCCGVKLVLKDDNTIKMKPLLNKKSNWKSMKDYKIKKKNWLMPYAEDIKKIFKLIEKYIDKKRKHIQDLI